MTNDRSMGAAAPMDHLRYAVRMRRAIIVGFLILSACAAPIAMEKPVDAPVDGDARSLLTMDVLDMLNGKPADELCEIATYSAQPTVGAAYTSKAYGLTVTLPYNPKWGTMEHQLPPFHDLPAELVVLFGPLQHGEACGLVRHWELRILPPRSLDESLEKIRAELQTGFGDQMPADLAPVAAELGGHAAIEYVRPGLCSYPTIEVIGKKFNYQLSYCAGGEDRSKDLQPLREIAQTMKFL